MEGEEGRKKDHAIKSAGRVMNYRMRWLEKIGIPRYGKLHLRGNSEDWYVFP